MYTSADSATPEFSDKEFEWVGYLPKSESPISWAVLFLVKFRRSGWNSASILLNGVDGRFILVVRWVHSFLDGGIRDAWVFLWKLGFTLSCFRRAKAVSGLQPDKFTQGTWLGSI